MTATLPWIIVLIVIALAAGFVLGRRAGARRVPTGDAPLRPVPVPVPSAPAARSPGMLPKMPSGAAPASPAAMGPGIAASPANLLARASTWGYQLQDLDVGKAAALPFDVLVVDAAHDGSDDTALKPGEIDRLKRLPDGGRRLVLAYLSIGEAESYRSYWRKEWLRDKPAWLLGENPDWEENYAVCFWDAGWQRLMCGAPDACLDRILAQGFDGVYLDKCDVTDDLRHHFKAAAATRRDLDADMTAFVEHLSTYAKAQRPGFLVVMQNAETLLESPRLRASLDAVAKEELLYGLDAPERPNSKGEIAEARDLLELLKADGKPVFVVEYLKDARKIKDAVAQAQALGYVLYVAPRDRELDSLNPPPST